ncbi:CatB-related O-acetyltransferase [Shimwellia pseudoproteus]|uniref:CatB-related O-acetyltransferase n=1 Tax=Shimwellia pseudoproteus TaxID=570012 RepID=UPI0018EB8092|nr:CatB-related O-acetyltransferase [Shimwellia pseudoproteus]MBJ3815337.1 CatB-related O-acetyltransferase [Shimwellia pseudoproteus]
MKIAFGEIKALLQAQRIFIGGQKLVCSHGFYRDDLAIEIPDNLATESYTTYWGRCGERLASLGAFSYTRTPLPALIQVGRYTSIADRLQVLGDRHPLEWASASPVFYARHSGVMATLASDSGRENHFHAFASPPRRIQIGNDVWIGQNVTLAQGITIGDGAVIAANALVVKDVAPYTVVGGNPAKPIRARFDEQIVRELLALQWWQYSAQDIAQFAVSQVELFCEQLHQAVQDKAIASLVLPMLTAADIRHYRDQQPQ